MFDAERIEIEYIISLLDRLGLVIKEEAQHNHEVSDDYPLTLNLEY